MTATGHDLLNYMLAMFAFMLGAADVCVAIAIATI